MTTGSFAMTLPLWVGAFLGEEQRICRSREERMRIAVSLSRLNVAHGTGGPFGAAVFEAESGRLTTPGVSPGGLPAAARSSTPTTWSRSTIMK